MTNNSTFTKFQEKKENIYLSLNGIHISEAKITAALGLIPRGIFTSNSLTNVDCITLVEKERAVMPPGIIAKILNHTNIKPEGSALVVGCGTGYLAAILSKLYSNIFAVESQVEAKSKASKNFLNLEIDNIILFDSYTSKNIGQQGPYDLIYIEGGTEKIPPLFFDQLSDGGQLITYVPTNEKIGKIVSYVKKEAFWAKKIILECWLPTFNEFKAKDKFVL